MQTPLVFLTSRPELLAGSVTFVEIVAVFTGALSGALAARVREGYDVVGMAALAFAAGLGGSITREILLQQGTPAALTHLGYLGAVASAIAVGWMWGDRLGQQANRVLLALDAIGLGWFAVAGAVRVTSLGLGPVTAILLGVVTAVGGGIARDLLLGVQPSVFRSGELYALAALVGIVAMLGALQLGLHPWLAQALGVVVGTGLRFVSMRLGWRSPVPPRRIGKAA